MIPKFAKYDVGRNPIDRHLRALPNGRAGHHGA
jgi:hypothetical protein